MANLTTKKRLILASILSACVLCTSTIADASTLDDIMSNMDVVPSSNACQDVAQQETAEAQSALQQCDQVAAATFSPPADVNNSSCLSGLMGSMSSTATSLESMVSGASLSGMLTSIVSGLGSQLESNLESQVCNAADSEWNNVSSGINSAADLPSTLGQEAVNSVTSAASNATSTVINQATAPVTQATQTIGTAAGSAGDSVSSGIQNSTSGSSLGSLL